MSYNPEVCTKLSKPGRFYAAYTEKLVVDLTFPEDSEYTDQSFREEADINTIMARYQSTGEMPVLNEGTAQWLDVTEMDFQRHMDFCIEAQGLFDDLPSDIRDRFGNDPGAFLGFVSDEKNRLEVAKMGLLTPEATDAILYPPEPAPKDPKEPSGY